MNEDINLLDSLKTHLDYQSDAQLADYLKLTRQAIYRIRAGEMKLGHLQRLKILDRLGYLRLVTFIKSLAPKDLAEEIARRIEDHTAAIALTKIEDGESTEADKQLLVLIKKFTNCETDEELANKIGLKRTSLSMVRKGKAKFGVYPRLKMLKLLDPEANLDEFEKALESSEELLTIINHIIGGESQLG
jgi:transcriptional regulator with XRE-family HTH domain